ncbi:MAG TPA: sensor histidine kinase [Chthoniobacteraceae bacterium]|nr:sensor histidine kinase [Chthoniobacteraceae bacterium]
MLIPRYTIFFFLLARALFAASAPTDALPTLQTGQEVRQLSVAEALRGYPVKIRGTVLLYDHLETSGTVNVVFLQDGQFGFCAENHAPPLDLRAGDVIDVEGVTSVGGYAPYIVHMRYRRIGTAPLPAPRSMSISEAIGGHEDAQWVEVAGVVRSEWITDRRVRMMLAAGRERLEVDFANEYAHLPAGIPPVDSKVSVRGVVSPIFNGHHQLLGSTLEVSGVDSVRAMTTPPADPFNSPTLRYNDLLQYSPERSNEYRVKVRGTVSFYVPGRAVFLTDGTRGLEVKVDHAVDVHPGDEVEALGFMEAGAYQPLLENGILRRIGVTAPPLPAKPANAGEALDKAYDCMLVETTGTLVQEMHTEMERVLLLRDGWRLYTAHLISPGNPKNTFAEGSVLKLTGICVSEAALSPDVVQWRPKSLEMLVSSPAAIAVLARPPWWTPQRVYGAAGMGAAMVGLLLVWITLLRRQVRLQTAVIQEQSWREATLEERNRIARELHDTLAQSFAGSAFALDAVASRLRNENHPIYPQVSMALETVRNGLTEARRSLSNLRSAALDGADAAGAIRDAAEELVKGSPVQLHLRLRNLRAPLPQETENNLYRIATEAMTNAVRHGSPRNLDVELCEGGDGIHLSIIDDGKGFDSGVTAGGNHYGVRGMRERAELIHGTLEITSAPGQGSAVRLTVPREAPQELANPPAGDSQPVFTLSATRPSQP